MKRIIEEIDVQHERNRPRLFQWRGSMFEVRQVLDWWIVQTGWWRQDGEVRRIFFRVVVRPLVQVESATSGVMEMYRQKEKWVLTKIID